MYVFAGKSRSLVKLPNRLAYRDDNVVLGGVAVNLTELNNPYLAYEVVSDKLTSGDYKFGIKSVDNLENYSTVAQGDVTISNFTMFPRFISLTKLNNPRRAILSWTQPATGNPDTYNIYSNNGDGSCDFTLYTSVSGSTTSKEVVMNVDGIWIFKIEAVKNSIESFNRFTASVEVPFNLAKPPAAFDAVKQITSVDAKNSNVGKIDFSFLWIYGSAANTFRLYHDRGSGAIYWNSFLEFTRVSGYYQRFTTEQIYFGETDAEFRFVVRAVNQYGVEDLNTEEHTVLLDGVAPTTPQNLILSTRM